MDNSSAFDAGVASVEQTILNLSGIYLNWMDFTGANLGPLGIQTCHVESRGSERHATGRSGPFRCGDEARRFDWRHSDWRGLWRCGSEWSHSGRMPFVPMERKQCKRGFLLWEPERCHPLGRVQLDRFLSASFHFFQNRTRGLSFLSVFFNFPQDGARNGRLLHSGSF